MLVSEKLIDSIAEKVESGELLLNSFVESLSNDQGPLWIYMEEEIFPVLTEEESDYLLFLFFIICKSMEGAGVEIPEIDLDDFQECEENNWHKFDESKAKLFKARLDVFFENYEEEDLLAFLEDMLTLEEEDVITSIGREPIFVFCKSVIDVCIRS